MRTYTVTVTRAAPSTDAVLRSLTLSGVDIGTVDPVELSYAASVDYGAATTTVTAEPRDAAATVVVSPADADAEAAGHQVRLAVGATSVEIRVIAQDTTTERTYTATIVRGLPSTDAALRSLTLSGIDLGAFDPDGLSYAASVDYAVSTTTVAAEARDAAATDRDHTGGRRRGDGGPPGGPGGGRDGRGGPGDGGGRDDDADLHGDGCAGGAGHVRRGRVGTGRRRRPGADRSAERGGPLPRPALPAGRGRSGDGVRGGDPCGRGTRRRAHGAAARRRGRRVPGCDVLEQRAGRPGRGRRGRPGGAWPSERGRAGAAERGAIAAARGRGDGDSRHGDVQVLGGRTSGQSSRGAGAAGELGVHEVRRRSSRVYMERRGDRLLHQYEQVAASPGLQEPVPRARLGDDVRHGHPPPRRGGAERRVRHLQLRVHQLGLAVRGRGQSARDYRRGHAVPVEQPGLLARGGRRPDSCTSARSRATTRRGCRCTSRRTCTNARCSAS